MSEFKDLSLLLSFLEGPSGSKTHVRTNLIFPILPWSKSNNYLKNACYTSKHPGTSHEYYLQQMVGRNSQHLLTTVLQQNKALLSPRNVKQFGMVQFCLPTVVILMKNAILAFERQTLSGLAKEHWLSKGSVCEHIKLPTQNSKHKTQNLLSKFP